MEENAAFNQGYPTRGGNQWRISNKRGEPVEDIQPEGEQWMISHHGETSGGYPTRGEPVDDIQPGGPVEDIQPEGDQWRISNQRGSSG